MLPPALFFNEFAASLGALARLGRRAKARHEKLVAAVRRGAKGYPTDSRDGAPALLVRYCRFAGDGGAALVDELKLDMRNKWPRGARARAFRCR